jgi:TetR/AcrR family transcriptional regulator, tetracycline repressor protein
MQQRVRKPAPRRGQISRQAVLEAGAAILATEGLSGLTMRAVAGRLGVEAMSLYNHVRDKRDLLAGIVGLKLSQLEIPDAGLPWPDRLRALALSFYRILTADPWLVLALTNEQIEPTEPEVVAAMESTIVVLEAAGLNRSEQVSAFRGLLAMCLGLVMTHTIGLRMNPSDAETEFAKADVNQWSGLVAPHLTALAPQFLQTRPGDDLQFMLDRYIAALGGEAI